MVEPEKVCFKCSISLPLSAYYRHKGMADGRLNKCKDCTKKDVRKHREANLDSAQECDRVRGRADKHRASVANYRGTARGKARLKAGKDSWRAKNPGKVKATQVVSNAVRGGKLTKLPCEVCGSTVSVQAHHDDYSKPLVVRWLCVKHHNELHIMLREYNRT